MPESNPLCRPVQSGISDGQLQDLLNQAKTRGNAHRAWIENRDGRKLLCLTFWNEESPTTAASPFLGEPVAPATVSSPAEVPSRDLDMLVEEFRSKVTALLDQCAARGTPMRPYTTLRSPLEQARLWRQSRSKEEIEAKIAELRSESAPFLADCIERVGSQLGDPVTNAIPGLSWHQWGEAVDCFWLVDGAAEWSAKKKINGLNGYQVYAEEAQAAGLTAGGLWTSFKDWPHVQLRSAGSPLGAMSLAEIDREMERRFGS
jgi:peptidoglycan L-alanyl-D-glutamate endopeptidase CwlK